MCKDIFTRDREGCIDLLCTRHVYCCNTQKTCLLNKQVCPSENDVLSICYFANFEPRPESFSPPKPDTLLRPPPPHLYCTHDFDIAAKGDEFIAPGEGESGIKEGILRREGEKYWRAPPTPGTRIPALARANLSFFFFWRPLYPRRIKRPPGVGFGLGLAHARVFKGGGGGGKTHLGVRSPPVLACVKRLFCRTIVQQCGNKTTFY